MMSWYLTNRHALKTNTSKYLLSIVYKLTCTFIIHNFLLFWQVSNVNSQKRKRRSCPEKRRRRSYPGAVCAMRMLRCAVRSATMICTANDASSELVSSSIQQLVHWSQCWYINCITVYHWNQLVNVTITFLQGGAWWVWFRRSQACNIQENRETQEVQHGAIRCSGSSETWCFTRRDINRDIIHE